MNKRIREIRKRENLSQAEFGAKINLSQRAIATIEQGGTVTPRNFDAICKTFSVNPDWLRNGVGEMFIKIETREAIIQSVVEEFHLTPAETILVRTFLELDNEQRAAAMEFITNFGITMAAKLGVAPPMPQRQKPDSELTRAEKHALLDAELDKQEAAEKRATATSSVSITSSG